MKSDDDHCFQLNPIGHVVSPYREKFAIPRQPGLVTAAQSHIRLEGRCNREEILRGLEDFSHIWIVFMFHEAIRDDWKPMVRPPRLGGNEKIGVFASRSPFRPNEIGLSVVELDKIDYDGKNWCIHFNGGDLLHKTPVLDIKPYLPYADAIPDAHGSYAADKPNTPLEVRFSAKAEDQLRHHEKIHENLRELITQVLAQQPQPAYQRDADKSFGMQLYNLNIRWTNSSSALMVDSIEPVIQHGQRS